MQSTKVNLGLNVLRWCIFECVNAFFLVASFLHWIYVLFFFNNVTFSLWYENDRTPEQLAIVIDGNDSLAESIQRWATTRQLLKDRPIIVYSTNASSRDCLNLFHSRRILAKNLQDLCMDKSVQDSDLGAAVILQSRLEAKCPEDPDCIFLISGRHSLHGFPSWLLRSAEIM